ncbi:MAG: 3,4-dihydroxy-2-butanone kinase [Alphaproteobacteria bacterium HGW-Alphaproteobacteria-6]|nr:MAG: 3,4-dihydroxy-2-butanone kinase [Alphaproteobacteria bacterium HGW-Alphaproteobacteria-6]
MSAAPTDGAARNADRARTKSPGLVRSALRFGEDPLVWASWLYYEEGLTQGEVAEAMNVSRPTVNAYLADARSKGIVNITISSERLKSLSIAGRLQEHFGLDECLVIPGEGGDRSLIDRLGAAGAQALGSLVHSGDTIGITWGRTMLAVARATENRDLKDIRVVQATGGTTAVIEYTPEACARRLAEALGARSIPISAPAILSSAEAKMILLSEPVVAEQIATFDQLDRIIFGVSSLRANSTIHISGFFDSALQQHDHYHNAVGSIAGRFIDANGAQVDGPLTNRTLGIELDQLARVPTRVLVAGGYDKVPAILAALRGGFVTVLVTDAATGEGILRADGAETEAPRSARPGQVDRSADFATRSRVKKFINAPRDAVSQSLDGALRAFPQFIAPIGKSLQAIRSSTAPRAGKVGLVIGGGAGHEPCFLGYVGPGLADAVAVGNVFASPPPDRVLTCTRFASTGAGVLYIYGNYTGDVMNFDMAAELAAGEGIDVRTILTTDDVASSAAEDRAGRRGTAGNVFVFKIAGAACDRMYPLGDCERLARKANAATFTMGLGLEPCSLPDTQRPSFRLGEHDMEVGIGIHGEPGVTRQPLETADAAADRIFDRLMSEMQSLPGARVALLVNSLGGTPMMELFILSRRIQQRLAARDITVTRCMVGHYCTSLDMVGASVTLMQLDDELLDLFDHPCAGFAWQNSPQ